MPDISATLDAIAAGRRRDPLAPVTVISPSNAAGLQMRRRLAEVTPFAGVRFETLPRVAELLGAGHLAAAGRSPLARPIGDYVAGVVARESSGKLSDVADLPGYARLLRGAFRRIRRGGIHTASEVSLEGHRGHLDEVLRLYDRFRDQTRAFYDDEDLLDEAASAVRAGRAGALQDLGAIYVMPPGALSAGGADFLAALREMSPAYEAIGETTGDSEARFILAPDPASEVREVVRSVLEALHQGVPVHEIAVFHGANPAYRRLLAEAFRRAEIPAASLPGTPLSETRAGRGVLELVDLPDRAYRRTSVLDFLSIAPLKEWLPGDSRRVQAMTTAWDRISRDAGVTSSASAWRQRLGARIADLTAAVSEHDRLEQESRVRAIESERDAAGHLLEVVETLVARLEVLRETQPAASFIETFKSLVDDYFDPKAAALNEPVSGSSSVMMEIDQLGTVAAVGGSFSLATFAAALRANLDAAHGRDMSLGEGVMVADYRSAAGLQFQHVVLCGAYEGALPAGPGNDAIVEDRIWSRLRESHPYIEDARARIDRAREAADRAVAAARRILVWACPLNESQGTREYYPSPMMLDAVRRQDSSITNASELRQAATRDEWLRKSRSPLVTMLCGPVADPAQLHTRQAISLVSARREIPNEHRLTRAVALLRARRSPRFTEWDGNLSALTDLAWLNLQKAVSPTSLENYAVCGFRYFCRSLLRLKVVEEPGERQMMDPASRGSLIHDALDRFFRELKEAGRPGEHEPWGAEDEARLLVIAGEEMDKARDRGITGLDVFGRHEARAIRTDLIRFLEEDYAFRLETGAVPTHFEADIPATEIAGVVLRGKVDRIDISPDGQHAWVIDYKTGSARDFDRIKDTDPLAGGKRLQLPTYLAAVPDVPHAKALYWFITRKGEFKQIPYNPTAENQELFRKTVEAVVAGVGRGAFPAVSGDENEYYGSYENCGFCDFDRICSQRRDQEFDIKGDDPGLKPWKAVGEAATRG